MEDDKVTLQFRLQKADQRAFGMNRAQFVSGKMLCVVEAVKSVMAFKPERFGRGREAHLPIC